MTAPWTTIATAPILDAAGNEGIELVARGLRSFTEIGILRKTLLRLPGVSAVRVRPEGRGVVALTVVYRGIVPFQVHLAQAMRRDRQLAHVELTRA